MTNLNKAESIDRGLAMSQKIIIAALEVDGGTIEDDHTGAGVIDASKDNVVIVEWNGHLCPFMLGRGGCCLNPLYLDNLTGRVRMSRWSVGPYFTDEQLRTSNSVKVIQLNIVSN